jgi:transcriptional regulator with XRE-family HTH domain
MATRLAQTADQLLLQQHLKQLRKTAKLTQTKLAEKLGKPQNYISKIENGERGLSLIEARAYCKACKYDIAKFVRAWDKDLQETVAE